MKKQLTVDLPNGNQFNVIVDYEIVDAGDGGPIGCSLHIIECMPVNVNDIAMTDNVLSDVEEAAAYKLVDEYNDGDTIEDDHEGTYYPC